MFVTGFPVDVSQIATARNAPIASSLPSGLYARAVTGGSGPTRSARIGGPLSTTPAGNSAFTGRVTSWTGRSGGMGADSGVGLLEAVSAVTLPEGAPASIQRLI